MYCFYNPFGIMQELIEISNTLNKPYGLYHVHQIIRLNDRKDFECENIKEIALKPVFH